MLIMLLSAYYVKSSVYDKDEINAPPESKQNSLEFIDPQYSKPPIAGFSLRVGSHTIPGLSAAPTLNSNNA